MYIETFIPVALALLSVSGAALILTRAPRRTATLMLSCALVVLSAIEVAQFLFLYNNNNRYFFVILGLEIPFLVAWFTGITLALNFKSERWLKRVSLCLIFIGGFIFLLYCAKTQWFFTIHKENPNILILGKWGRIHTLFILFPSIFLLWFLESIYRRSSKYELSKIKYPILGVFIISGVQIWQAGLRLSYLTVDASKIPLHSAIMLIGVGIFLFYVIRYKLFNLQIFISRYIVYNSFVLAVIGFYLLALGGVGIGVRYLGYSIPFIIKWLFIFVTGLIVFMLLLSHELRTRVKLFINTHFFENKYDYRSEWVKFSGLLSKTNTREEVIRSLQSIIQESMFVQKVRIWLGNDVDGFTLQEESEGRRPFASAEEPLVRYLRYNNFFLHFQGEPRQGVDDEIELVGTSPLVQEYNINLAAPLVCANEFFGFVALDEELSGLPFNQDDVDLITALSSQAAVSLMTIKLGVTLSEARELSLINKVSAFVLHDLKNAAAMLSLLNQSAPKHIHKPEYQHDMMEAVENALNRIQRVMKRLQFAKATEVVTLETINLSASIKSYCNSMENMWEDIELKSAIAGNCFIKGSPDWIQNILENLFINAKDAITGTGVILVEMTDIDEKIIIDVSDNGMGISNEFIENKLFRPFQTTKDQGLGIGLWQVKHYVESMGGNIEAYSSSSGTRFRVSFPAVRASMT